MWVVTMTNVKPIDGTGDDKKAPRPQRGMTKAVFDCIDACGGANFKQVQKYLPAAIQNSGQIITKKRLEKVLYSAVYQGYLVHDSRGITDKGYWKVAPLSYYNARKVIISDLKRHPRKRRLKPSALHDPHPMWHWHLLVSIAAFAYLLGLISGMYLK